MKHFTHLEKTNDIRTCCQLRAHRPPARSLAEAVSRDLTPPSQLPTQTCPENPRSSPAGRSVLREMGGNMGKSSINNSLTSHNFRHFLVTYVSIHKVVGQKQN